MPNAAVFNEGDNVVLRSTREMGRIQRPPTLDGGEYWYRVQFVKRIENVVEDDLDPLDEVDESLEHLATEGRWGRIQAVRCALAVERITRENRNTVYSFRAQRILFEPYQYKPLLKILDSPDRRLLIADEVGMGKTIEAGLILTELAARRPMDRILIVCPSRLRDKWREEMNRKFDQDFDIYTKSTFVELIERIRENPRRGQFRGIISMQTLRNDELRELLTGEIGHLDMVVIDEAHHSRNPHTKVSAMLRDLCEVGDCVLLLTATPMHLGSRDLFTLLQALRPVEFRDAEVFDRQLRKYSGVHKAGQLVRASEVESLDSAKKLLHSMFVSSVSPANRDPLALQVIEEIESSPPQDRRGWIEIERRIQELHPLASIVTRTRKRDVLENAPVRRAAVFYCQWTPEEDEAYQRLVNGSTECGWIRERLSLGQIQRARQAASCLPAAIEAKLGATIRVDDDAVETTDILPSDVEHATSDDPSSGQTEVLDGVDSKYEKLQDILSQVWSDEPKAKVLIFTFFVGTSNYLMKRLADQGVAALRIAGDVPSDPRRPDRDERGKRMRQFRDDPDTRVLISTEVGSEGLDFQFCHHVVNYDLPWNPMVVEQRIGRIDRYGQKSDVVNIHNLVVNGTVEDRILLRLYQRIGIFEQSIGDLEAILGETMSELQRDYVSGLLTPEESEHRVEQAASAINRRRDQLDQLETNAGELFGHEEYIRDEMKRVGQLGRFVSEESLLAVIAIYLESHHPNAGWWKEEPGIYGIRLTDSLRRDIHGAAAGLHSWVDRSRDNKLLVTFQGELAFQFPQLELVNVTHPLVQVAADRVSEQLKDPLSRIAQTSVQLNVDEDPEIPDGLYYLLVFTHTVDGIRARRILETVAWSETDDKLIVDEYGERLLHLALQRGKEWDAACPAPPITQRNWSKMHEAARNASRELREREIRENDALYIRRKVALQAEFDHSIKVKKTRLRTAEARGHERVLPALHGQVQKAEAEHIARMKELEQTKEVRARLSEPLAACVIDIRR